MTRNVLCMKWGQKYGPDYVNRLYRMVRRNLQGEFRFLCLTDDAAGLGAEGEAVEARPIPRLPELLESQRSPWRKLALYAPEIAELGGRCLFLDLDIVIVAALDPFFEIEGDFLIIENWTQMGRGIGNSSVLRFESGAHQEIYGEAQRAPEALLRDFSNEQIFVSRRVPGKTYWPRGWCVSFKQDLRPAFPLNWIKRPALPADARIVVFHGYPDPPEALRHGPLVPHKYFRPASWVADYWR